jgi:peptidoglycan/LPS O-acetylase OafA/YrhL
LSRNRSAVFLPLESVRGLCAVTIVYHHLKWSHWIGDLGVVANASLLVELFFALSAFVMAHRYLDRIGDVADYLRFMWLRAARILPLHLAVLGVWLACGVHEIAAADGSPVDLVASPDFLKRVFLLHAVFGSELPWNVPSWSVAVEAWAYVAFGGVLVATASRRRTLAAVFATTAFAAFLLLAFVLPEGIFDFTGPATLARCMYAFSLGTLGYVAFEALGLQDRHLPGAVATCLEIACIAALFSTITIFGDSAYAVAVPVLFPAVLCVLAWGRGLISSLLRLRWLVGLGTLSYSIYMLHAGLWAVGMRLVRTLDAQTPFTGYSKTHPGQLEFFGSTPATFLVATGFVAFVVLCSAASYRFLERPARDAMRRWIEPGTRTAQSAASPTGAIAISDTRAMPTA